MHNLTAIIITKNEENNIIDAIDSVSFADKILILDDNSTDNTLDLIKSLNSNKVTLLSRKLTSFSDQRNFALNKVSTPWALFVDADERVSKDLANEIANILKNPTHNAYKIKRIDSLWNKKMKYGDLKDQKFIRLAKKTSGKWTGRVHEKWNINDNVGELSGELLHFPHPSISEFLDETNIYSSKRAEELHSQKTKSNLFSILIYPLAKFLTLYLLRQGYKDGTYGFVHAILMSFYSFLVRSKLYLLWKKR